MTDDKKRFASIWDALEDDPEKRERLKQWSKMKMTVEAHKELIEAARELLPHLHVWGDERHQLDDIHMNRKVTQADRLRAEADQVEAKEAAIWRFRKAMEPFKT